MSARWIPCLALGLLATAIPGMARAQVPAESGVTLVVLEPDSGLIQRLGSRYALEVTLPRPVDYVECGSGQGGAGVMVESLSVQPVNSRTPPAVFRRGERLIPGNEPCGGSLLFAPLTVDPQRPLDVVVRLSDGQTVRFPAVQVSREAAEAARQSDSVVQSRFELLHGDDDGRIGLGWSLAADLRLLAPSWPLVNAFDEASIAFEGETAAKDESFDFKETMTLETRFVSRFGPITDYYALVLEPISFESTADGDSIDYRGGAHFVFEVPGSRELIWALQPTFGGCRQSATVNCTAWGLMGSVGYTANHEIRREAGVVNRSADFVTTASALWEFPLNDTLHLRAAYDWQSDSDDGSSSEKREVALTFLPRCGSDIGLTLSWIDGEFFPGEQRREAVRLGLSKLLGPRLAPVC